MPTVYTFPISGAPSRVTNPNEKGNWKISAVQRLLGVNPMPTDKQVIEFTRYLKKGDPLADDMVLWMHEAGLKDARKIVNQALEEGIESIENPPEALAAVFKQVDAVPLWVDPKKLDLACDVSRRIGPMAELALGPVALMGAYVSAAAVKPLAFTSQLDTATTRRLAETGKFWVDVTTRGGLKREREGFKSAVRVRLMHAQVRSMLGKSEKWRADDWGTPLNQADTVATILLFSTIFILTLRFMGFRFTKEEREAVVHLWRYIGFLMGIDEAILPANEDDSLRAMVLQYLTLGESDEDTFKMGQALTQAPIDRMAGVKYIPNWLPQMEMQLRSGISRFILGGKSADALGLPNNIGKFAMVAASPVIFSLETLRKTIPGGTKASVLFGRLLHEKGLKFGLDATGADTTFTPVKNLAR